MGTRLSQLCPCALGHLAGQDRVSKQREGNSAVGKQRSRDSRWRRHAAQCPSLRGAHSLFQAETAHHSLLYPGPPIQQGHGPEQEGRPGAQEGG